MTNIDKIMDMLDCNNSQAKQRKGIRLARNVRSINVFLQPLDQKHNKNVWENCAKILAERTDEELAPYLVPLLEWLQDMNWPGAFCILERMRSYAKDASYRSTLEYCLKQARRMEDDVWLENLKSI